MKLYHRTSKVAAVAIQRDGFRDGRGAYLTAEVHEGVWLSNVPLDENEGAEGPVLLSVSIPLRVVARYEWIEDGKGYREFLVPAAVVNRYPVRVEAIRDWPEDDPTPVRPGRAGEKPPVRHEGTADRRRHHAHALRDRSAPRPAGNFPHVW